MLTNSVFTLASSLYSSLKMYSFEHRGIALQLGYCSLQSALHCCQWRAQNSHHQKVSLGSQHQHCFELLVSELSLYFLCLKFALITVGSVSRFMKSNWSYHDKILRWQAGNQDHHQGYCFLSGTVHCFSGTSC